MYLIGMTVAQNHKRAGLRGRGARLIESFSVDEPRYLLGQVAFAAGISSNLLKAWIERKIVPLGEHDRAAHGKGSSRVFTLRRALVVAHTAELVRLGIPPSMAGSAGRALISLDSAGGDPLRVDLLMALYPEDDAYAWHPLKPQDTVAKLLGKDAPRQTQAEPPASLIVISAKAITRRVLRRLGELE
jgi:hypothetical protein